ncbi:unnamed protein product [Ceutorhynchus assimilis]|uniref:Centrosomal protein of 135 kDa n=1 Tax=Ceutorhynchus assimilis TaxID=467358 RepID=A0A9N9MGM5_9CUCU|nr:unnamed protein product [Ceutorhynchus assimilis]
MGSKYEEVRQELDSFGYIQKLVPECVPLVQKLLLDLKITTENLEKYMKISQRALDEKDSLELGVEPYKCDNGKLIKECNDLHMAFINFKEQHEKMRRGKSATKDPQINNKKEGGSFRLSSDMAVAEAKIVQLNKELKDLADKHLRLVEDNAVLNNKLKTRDDEICRLHSLVEGGRTYASANKDCCFKNIDGQIVVLQDEITQLKKERKNLQLENQEALAKQHEAMRRALHLAGRNRQLEKELRDVDQIALAVEAECNSTVKDNTEKVARLQDRINESLILIQTLERDNTSLKQTKLELSAELNSVKLEKHNLQKQLENEIDNKKELTDKINSFTVIENDLNLEIDRLSKLNSEQKRKIVELESQVENPKIQDKKKNSKVVCFEPSVKQDGMSKQKSSTLNGKKSCGHKKNSKKASNSPPLRNLSPSKLDSGHQTDFTEAMQKCCCDSGNCIKNLKELLDKEIEYRQGHTKQALDDVKQEKDFYMKEYHKVLEQIRNVPSYEISETGITQLKQQLRDKDNKIKQLENEIVILKVEQTRRNSELQGLVGFSPCNNPNCKSKEREMEVKSRELSHLNLENEALAAKLRVNCKTTFLQSINEAANFNEEKVKSAFKEMEEHIRKLEDERRDLVKGEITQRSNISHLEDNYRRVQEQLKQTQAELNCQRASYEQLKQIHEQADRSLSDVQAQLIKVEKELASYKNKCRDSNRDASNQDMQIATLKSDIQLMKNQLTTMDRQKDALAHDLDTKMDKISSLEDELDKKIKMVSKLESLVKDLNKKLR